MNESIQNRTKVLSCMISCTVHIVARILYVGNDAHWGDGDVTDVSHMFLAPE